MRGHQRVVDVRNVVSQTGAEPVPVRRIAYNEEHYANAGSAVSGMRERMIEGWRVAVIRGPSTGPFAVVYEREVRRER